MNKGFRVSDIRLFVCSIFPQYLSKGCSIFFVFSALLLKRLLYKCIDMCPVILKKPIQYVLVHHYFKKVLSVCSC